MMQLNVEIFYRILERTWYSKIEKGTREKALQFSALKNEELNLGARLVTSHIFIVCLSV